MNTLLYLEHPLAFFGARGRFSRELLVRMLEGGL